MAYRSFSTETWQDPWFETLSPKAKLLFIYLWTNDVCNQAGCYEISSRRVEFETGLKFSETIKELAGKVEWIERYQIIWVKAFFRRQCANEKFAYAGIRSLHSIPKEIVEKFTQHNQELIEKHGIDTVSIPFKEADNYECTVSESVTDTDTDTVPDTEPVYPSKRNGIGFDDFWKAYPKKIGKQEARRAWERSSKKRPELTAILAKLDELKLTDQWTKQNGQFIPNPATWINRGGWDDECSVECIDEVEAWTRRYSTS